MNQLPSNNSRFSTKIRPITDQFITLFYNSLKVFESFIFGVIIFFKKLLEFLLDNSQIKEGEFMLKQ